MLTGGTALNANFPVETQYSPASCSDGGTASANPFENLNPPYTYLWNNGDTSQTIMDLDTGKYTVEVTDVFGNTGFGMVHIDGINALQVSDTITTASNSQPNGAVSLGIHGGSGHYSVVWDNHSTSLQRSNLAAGLYMVTVTDDTLGCSVIHTAIVGEESVGLTLKVLLEGAYDATTLLMYDTLRTNNLLPLAEPFITLEFNRPHFSGEIMDSTLFDNATLHHNNIVDWVLVELRDATYPSVVLKTRAGLLQRDGDIVDLDGISPLEFDNIVHQSYYIAIRHRNHLGIMTLNTCTLDENGLTLNFTDGSVSTYGTQAQKNINGKYVMISGDGNKDGQVNAVDKNIYWQVQNGETYYYHNTLTDFNLDGQINAVDKNLFWIPNNSKETQIPD
jgi:hypothetical protein